MARIRSPDSAVFPDLDCSAQFRLNGHVHEPRLIFEESGAMRKWAMRIFGGLVILILIVVSAGAIYQWLTSRREIAKNPAPGELVDIGGYKLHIWCEGSGVPTVILDTGLG